MRLKQKQFVPFMITMAVITVVIIIFSSFNFTHKQEQRFMENISDSDSLKIMPLRMIGSSDVTSVQSKKGINTILVFWASWSEKSEEMLNEIEYFQAQQDSFSVIAALVKDAEKSLPENPKYPGFTYVDGVRLFNHLKVPGFPSYILFDENGEVLKVQVGYNKGVGYDSLKVYLE